MAKVQKQPPSFEQTIVELESIVSKLEIGNLPLDEALDEFEKGVKLAKNGQIQLKKAEQRIQILLNENSSAELTDFIDNNE